MSNLFRASIVIRSEIEVVLCYRFGQLLQHRRFTPTLFDSYTAVECDVKAVVGLAGERNLTVDGVKVSTAWILNIRMGTHRIILTDKNDRRDDSRHLK